MAIGRRQSTESRALPSAGACDERVDGGCWSSASVASSSRINGGCWNRRRRRSRGSCPRGGTRIRTPRGISRSSLAGGTRIRPRRRRSRRRRRSLGCRGRSWRSRTSSPPPPRTTTWRRGRRRRPRARLTREQRELHRFRNVLRKGVFICFVRVKGHLVNILSGLELHAGVFSTAKQKRIVDCVYDLQEMGKRGELGEKKAGAHALERHLSAESV